MLFSMAISKYIRQVDRFRDVLKPHFLRRLKSDVFKELPLKSELIIPVTMSPLQKDVRAFHD